MARKQQETFKAMQANPTGTQTASDDQALALAQLNKLDEVNDKMGRLIGIQERSLKMQS